MRLIVAGAICLLHGACVPLEERAIGDARVLNASSTNRALVIFGMHGVHPDPQSFWEQGQAHMARALDLEWAGYDTATGTLSQGGFRAARKCQNHAGPWDAPEFCLKRMTTHHVVEVAPGDYVLSSLTTTGYKRSRTTRFVKKMDWLGREQSARETGSPRFRVKAGEVVYIGDYYFDTWNFPFRPLGVRLRRSSGSAPIG